MGLLPDFQDSFGGPREARFPDWATDRLPGNVDGGDNEISNLRMLRVKSLVITGNGTNPNNPEWDAGGLHMLSPFAKDQAPSGGYASQKVFSNNSNNPETYLQYTGQLITDPTPANRRWHINCIEQGTGGRTVSINESGGGFSVGPWVDGKAPGNGDIWARSGTIKGASMVVNDNGHLPVNDGGGLYLGMTTAKNATASGGEGALKIQSNDAANALLAYLALITAATAGDRRVVLDAMENGVAVRGISLGENSAGVSVGTWTGAPGAGNLRVSGYVEAMSLPTADPHVAGRMWRSGNDMKISTG